jgi:hypothetical protein
MSARSVPTTMGSLLERCLDRIAGEPGAAAIWRVWDDAVGAHIARRAQPIRLRGRTLLVAVASAPWMQELQLLKRTLLAELNARLATPLVSDVHFVLTELGDEPHDPALSPRAAPRACPSPPAPADLEALPEPLRVSLDGIASAWRRRSRA